MIHTNAKDSQRLRATKRSTEALAIATRPGVCETSKRSQRSFRERRKLSDRPVRLRGLSRRPRLGVGKPALQDLVLGLQSFNVGFEDEQKRRIIRADGRGAGRKCGHNHVTSGDPVEPVLLKEEPSVT